MTWASGTRKLATCAPEGGSGRGRGVPGGARDGRLTHHPRPGDGPALQGAGWTWLAQIRGEGEAFRYLPDVAGGTSLMYNLSDATGARVTNLQLSSATAGGIFTGAITSWNDPKIAADNGGRPFPDEPIIPVIRSDGSGTSAQFSLYLKAEQPPRGRDRAPAAASGTGRATGKGTGVETGRPPAR